MRHSCYWFETSKIRNNNGVGLVKNVDVLVIGGGVIGTNILLQLISGGISNSYLVEEVTPGYHASGRSSGQLMLRGGDLFCTMPKDRAIEYLKFLTLNVRGFAALRIRVDFNQSGGLRLATTQEELSLLERELDFINSHAHETGISGLSLNEEKVRSIFPSIGFIGGIYLPCEGTVNPYKVISSIRDIIESKGSRILSHSRVDNIRNNSDGSFSVSIRNRGIINTKKIVYCTNAYSSDLLPELSSFMVPYRGQMLATDTLSDPVLKVIPQMSISCNHGHDYMRLHDNRLLFGGQRYNVRGRQEGTTYDGEISKTVFKRQKDFLDYHLPFLKTRYTHVWSGIMCNTRDGLPLIGELRPNEYIAAGFNGYGFSHSFMTGALMRDIIISGTSSLPGINIFDPKRILNV